MRKIITLIATAFIGKPALVTACAVCLAAPGDPTADAFNWSVIFLMAAPYAVVGSIAGLVVYRYRRGAAKRAPNEATTAPLHVTWSQKESGR